MCRRDGCHGTGFCSCVMVVTARKGELETPKDASKDPADDPKKVKWVKQFYAVQVNRGLQLQSLWIIPTAAVS